MGKYALEFPETIAEVSIWRPTVRTHALAAKVLSVAKTRIGGTWAAYIDAVPGRNHDMEYEEVLNYGDRLPEKVARVLYPFFEDIPYAK